jgi:hypothetical protein
MAINGVLFILSILVKDNNIIDDNNIASKQNKDMRK